MKAHRLIARNWCDCFQQCIRKDGDDYFLVTPVEKLKIEVEDAPFIAVLMRAEGEGAEKRLDLHTEYGR